MKEITIEELENLLICQCNLAETLDYFSCTEKELNDFCKQNYQNKTFGQLFKEKTSLGKANLRKLQFKHAESSVQMAIWLGKQYLGQEEKQKVQNDSKFVIVNDIPKSLPNSNNKTSEEKRIFDAINFK